MKRKTAKSANMFRIALFVVFLGFCSGQMIIPPRPLGFVYGNGSNDAFIHLDAHFGPLCPDSKAALPNLKQVADYYGGMKLKLTLHMFPLPYHHQAYLAAVGGEVVSSLTDDNDTYMYIEEVYSNLEILSNDATSNMSSSDVMNTLGDLALACCGVDKARFLAATKIKGHGNKGPHRLEIFRLNILTDKFIFCRAALSVAVPLRAPPNLVYGHVRRNGVYSPQKSRIRVKLPSVLQETPVATNRKSAPDCMPCELRGKYRKSARQSHAVSGTPKLKSWEFSLRFWGFFDAYVPHCSRVLLEKWATRVRVTRQWA
ncbi:uncharacterized protein LOC128231020 [Mya arenaria]|uniref:uncharacterized protein LOC128231020 n=1 Tax=Mya arenaria TaxID=6604 RepID=UPI0022E2F326|nr:uncharacterized protein LOC128231020 [Mya arenaria]